MILTFNDTAPIYFTILQINKPLDKGAVYMKKSVLNAAMAAAAVFLGGTAVSANDCSVVFGRNDEVVGVWAKNISMREEEIIITLRKDHYEVDVTFDFFNSGAAENIKLGFPVEGDGWAFYNFRDNNVHDFKSYINGKIIPHTQKTDTLSAGHPNGFGAHLVLWFIRNVTFPANSRTVSRVTYKAKYNSGACWEDAGYIYGTGRLWKSGTIGKMTLVVNHGDDVVIRDLGFITGNHDSVRVASDFLKNGVVLGGNIKAESAKFIWEANGKYRFVFENVTPTKDNEDEDEERIRINVAKYESGLYSTCNPFGGFHPDEDNKFDYLNVNFEDEKYDFDWLWSNSLLYRNPNDIWLFTRNQIRLFINSFFARRGYDFKNKLYRDYFGKLTTKEWSCFEYKVNPKFKESDFNEFERKNIDYLLKLEKMIPKDSTATGNGHE